MAKTMCPIGREKFLAGASPLTFTVTDAAGRTIAQTLLSPRAFASGGYGWFGQVRPVVVLDGAGIQCTGSVNLSAVGSKDRTAADAE